MPFTLFNGELVLRGSITDRDFALITVRMSSGDHTVQVYWAGLEHEGVKEISPVEITLPKHSLEQSRGRQMQSLESWYKHSLSSAPEVNTYACRMAALMDRLIRQPLTFLPIQLGRPLVVRAVVIPEETHLPNVPIGIVSDIKTL